jgi:hypothetical protein
VTTKQDLYTYLIEETLKDAKHGFRNMRLKSTPYNSTVNSVIGRLDIQEGKDRRFTAVVDSVLSTQLMQAQGLIERTTMMSKPTLDRIKWWSGRFQLLLQTQLEQLAHDRGE